MQAHSIHISESDRNLIERLLAALSHDPRGLKITERLRGELARATVHAMRPANVVGLNCTAEVLDLDTREVDRFTLTLPERSDLSLGRLSILTPMGTAILGFAVGDAFEWEMPGGARRLQITKVSPETAVPAPSAVAR